MTKPATFPPLSALPPLPVSPIPSSRALLDDKVEEVFSQQLSYKKGTAQPLDTRLIKQMMKTAGKSTLESYILYGKVVEYIKTSAVETPEALLTSAVCLLIMGQFFKDNNRTCDNFYWEANAYLRKLDKTLKSEQESNFIFLYLMGCAHLSTVLNPLDLIKFQKIIDCFLGAAQLMPLLPEKPAPQLQQSVFLGVSLSHLYKVRGLITLNGTQQQRGLLRTNLETSESYLKKALTIYSDDLLKYMDALIRSLIALILDEEALEKRTGPTDESKEKLLAAKQIMEEIPTPSNDILALLGILQYRLAFGDQKIDYGLGCAASTTLLESSDDSLKMIRADGIRQIAWLLPVDVIQHCAEESLKIDASTPQILKRSYECNLLVYQIQAALRKLIELNDEFLKKPTDKDSIRKLVSERQNLISGLKSHLIKLKSMNISNASFSHLQQSLKHVLALLEKELPALMKIPATTEEQIAYNSCALKIGNLFDSVFCHSFVKFSLISRLISFDFTLELDLL